MTQMEILSAGPLTTVQDSGRFGTMSAGFSQSGVMDAASYELANRLLGNTAGEAVLEMSYQGITARFTGPAVLVLTGALMPASLNGKPLHFGTPFVVKEGDQLVIGAASSGCFSYLAVAGGIDVPVLMNSRSTNLAAKVGGYQGRKLQAGDVLAVGRKDAENEISGKGTSDRRDLTGQQFPSVSEEEASASVPKSEPVLLSVIPDEEESMFTKEGIAAFYNSTYRLSAECDRMGFRLTGPAVETFAGSDVISEGTMFGSVQIPSSGVPIILMADRQTTGGYAKIGCIRGKDLPHLAQCRPGTQIRFRRLDVSFDRKMTEEESMKERGTDEKD